MTMNGPIQNFNQKQNLQIATEALFHQACSQRWLDKFRSICGNRSRRLLDLAEVQASCTGRGQRDLGKQSVAISQIQGSANNGRCRDFDADFRPLQAHDESRWLNVAMAWLRGAKLPPVILIKVGEVYFVQDGHHRISVAKALGKVEVEAMVTVWQVAGSLPWEKRSDPKKPTPKINFIPEEANA